MKNISSQLNAHLAEDCTTLARLWKITLKNSISNTVTTGGSVPASAIQVTFNPAIWTAGFGTAGDPGSNGYNAFSVIPDQDGTTFWAFEYFGAGFARVNYSDGSIVHQGAMFGNPGFTDFWYNREDGSSALAQDDQGHYFVMPNHSSTNQVLYKFSIGAGSAGNLLDGYCTNPTTLNLSGFVGNEGGSGVRQVEGWNQVIAPAADGNRYLAICNDGGSPAVVVINTATMAVVGNYSYAIGATYWSSFMDRNGDFWFVVTKGDHRNDVALVHWHPQDGVTGSNLNVTVHDVSAATLGTGTNGIDFGTYVSSNHSVLLGNTDNAVNGGWDGQMINISLTTFTQNAFHATDGTFFYSGTFDLPQSTMMVGEQGSGVMMAGDVNPHVANSHLGGILNFIDPVALTLTSTLDATGLILTNGFLAGGTFHDFHSGNFVYCPLGNVAYSHANNAAAVTFEFVGSAVGIITLPHSTLVTETTTISTLAFTDHDKDILYDSVNYVAATGFTASAVESKSDMSPDNLDVTLFLTPDAINENDIRAGSYRDADVEIRLVNYADLTQGDLKLRKGNVGVISMKNGLAQVEIRGLNQKLTTIEGSTYGPVCRAQLFSDDAGTIDPTNRWKCRLNRADYVQSGTVVSAPDALTLVLTAGLKKKGSATPTAAAPTGWFSDGVLTWTGTSANNPRSEDIKSSVLNGDNTVTLTLFLPMAYPPVAGDTFDIEPGCNKLGKGGDCKNKFNNMVNFAAEETIPGIFVLLETPDAHTT